MNVLDKSKNLLSRLNGDTEDAEIFKNTIWLFSERIIRLIVGFSIGVWVTRYLGPDRYGILSFATSFAVLFASIASLGVDNIFVRDLVRKRFPSNELLGTALGIKLFGASLSFTIVLITIFFTEIETEIRLFILLIAGSSFFNSANLIDFFFQSRVKSKFIVVANTATLLLSSAIKIYLITQGYDLVYFVFVLLVESILKAIFYAFAFKKFSDISGKWIFNPKIAKLQLLECWPLVMSGLAISVGLRIDQVMLKSFVSDSELGFYAVGVRLAELFAFVPLIVSQSLFPKIIKTNFDTERSKLKKMIAGLYYPLILGCLFTYFVAEILVDILYGAAFEKSAVILIVLIWTIPLSFLGAFTNRMLMTKGWQKIVFFKQFLLMSINIVLNIVLIPRYGIIGAAFATLTADLFVNLFADLLFRKSRWIFLLKIESFFLKFG